MKYEKWSLTYCILKQYIRFVDWMIHKEIRVVGRCNIPKNKPIVFAPNHQNALSDAMAILINTNLQPVWLARADLFRKGFISRVLRFLKVMPVYRMRDGKENLSKNDVIFERSIEVLKNKGVLALYPEAAHTGKRQMIAHKKAIPKIVFMAEEASENNLDIHIIPTGIYYSSYWKFNRSLLINFGTPIRVNDYLEAYGENPAATILCLRQKIHDAIDELVINIRSKKYYNSFENIRAIYGTRFLNRQNKINSLTQQFHSDRTLMAQMDVLANREPETIEVIISHTNHYLKLLKKYKLKNWLVENPGHNLLMVPALKIILLLGFPLFLFGFIFNALPFFATDIITRKNIKDHAFWSTVFLVSGILFFPVVYALELWAISPLLPGIGLKLLFLFCLPLSGKIAFLWYTSFLKLLGRNRLLLLKFFRKTRWNELKSERDKLVHLLDSVIHTNKAMKG